MNKIAEQRYMREYQRKRRGSQQSYRTQIEDLHLFLAWQAGELSEGQMARILDLDRVILRAQLDNAIARGSDIGDALWKEIRKPLARLERKLERAESQAAKIKQEIRSYGPNAGNEPRP